MKIIELWQKIKNYFSGRELALFDECMSATEMRHKTLKYKKIRIEKEWRELKEMIKTQTQRGIFYLQFSNSNFFLS